MIPVHQIGEEVGEGPAGTTRHIYPGSAMVGDYLRAAAGLVPTGIVFAIEPVGTVAATVLGSLVVVFAAFGLRTVVRHATRMEMTDTELRVQGAWPRTIAWVELDRMKLGYYSTRRDRKGGWMQLQLGAGAVRVTLDSRIAGFNQLVQRAAAVAVLRDVALSEATIANLEALGIRPPEPGAGR